MAKLMSVYSTYYPFISGGDEGIHLSGNQTTPGLDANFYFLSFQLSRRTCIWIGVLLFLTLHWCVTAWHGNAAFEAPFSGSRFAFLARFRSFQDATSIIKNAHEKFSGRAWKLNGNDVLVLPEKYMDEVRRLPPHLMNAMQANTDNMQGKYTHLDILNSTRFFVNVVKRRVNPQLGVLTPTLRRELDAAIAAELPAINDNSDDWISINAFFTFHRILGRISARMWGGHELRDNLAWRQTVAAYLHNIFATAITLRFVPDLIKGPVSCFIPLSWAISYYNWKAKRILLPYIHYRLKVVKERAQENAKRGREEEFPDLLQYLIEEAQGRDAEPANLAAMVLALSLATNHTSTMAMTETLFDLCIYPEYQDELRQEVEDALELDGGWKKTTILKLRKLDSFMKESQRYNPPSLTGLKCKIIQNVTLRDGLELPAGAHLEFPISSIQNDHTERADEFDGLRYYRMRQEPGHSYRHQFATTSNQSAHFGHGTFSCPGRFMASSMIKMVLGTLLTEFEFKLDPNQSRLDPTRHGRPLGIKAFEFTLPSPTAKLLIRRRRVPTTATN